MSPWGKCTHMHEGKKLWDDLGRAYSWTQRTETQQDEPWQGKLLRLNGAGLGDTGVPGKRVGP